MARVVKPPYPEALTVKFWNKAKGLLARIRKIETGITKELEDALDKFEKAPWDDLVSTTFLTKHSKGQGSRTAAHYEDMLRLYLEKNHPPFKALERTYYDLSQFLKQKARDFESDDATKGFAKAVTKMADAANKFTYAVAFGTVSSANQAEFAKFKEEALKVEKQWAAARGEIKNMIDRAADAIDKAAKKVPTASGYAAIWKQELRGIGAQVAMAGKGDTTVVDLFKEPLGVAKKHWSEGGLPKGDQDVAAHIKKDVELLKKFKVAAGRL